MTPNISMVKIDVLTYSEHFNIRYLNSLEFRLKM